MSNRSKDSVGHGLILVGNYQTTDSHLQGAKLWPAGRQCDWKLSVGDQNFKASRQEATNFQRLVNVFNRRSRK